MDLNEEIKSAFMSYAMSTILSRALPDGRDGLKPVHRRVLYAMHTLNLSPEGGYRKCARVVGEVLGKFHPHGDTSVYDALVRMAQDFVMICPLVQGHGNFGSIDNDPPAAMRYTEAKLSSVSNEVFLSDIKEDTVDFTPNFDGNEEEPIVLPAKLPMLLLTGASGIAVGMATNIPPHNLGEVCDAVVALIDNPELSFEELTKIIPAPDFPTGGKILGTEGSKVLYSTGNGRVQMRANCHYEIIQSGSGKGTKKNAIIVTELPYGTNKAGLLEKIAELVNDKKIDGISDLRDESDRDGIRVVIELKRDANPDVVQNNLFKKTALQTAFAGNMLALVDEGKQPQRLTLKKCLDLFIDFRFQTVRRRTSNQLKKLENREHIVQGLLIALDRVDEIIAMIRQSKDSASAKAVLCGEGYNLSNAQTDAILALRLSRLTTMESSKLEEEHRQLKEDIGKLRVIMQQDNQVFDIIRTETLALKKKFAIPRRTLIVEEKPTLEMEDLVENGRSVVMVMQSGYIKRIPLDEFEAQSRGGRGRNGAKLATDQDRVAHFFSCNDHDSIIFVSANGRGYQTVAHQIPQASRTAKGTPIPSVLSMAGDDKITVVLPVDKWTDDRYLILLTKNGIVKRSSLNMFKNTVRNNGIRMMNVEEGDETGWARLADAGDELLLATKNGFATRFSIDDLRERSGRNTKGVRAIKLREGDEVADVDVLKRSSIGTGADGSTDTRFLVVTSKGIGKLIPVDESGITSTKRGAKGMIAIKFKEGPGTDTVNSIRAINPDDEVAFSTSKGIVIRQSAAEIPSQSRTAKGVKLQKLPKDDFIIMVDVLVPEATDSSGLLPPAQNATKTLAGVQ